jgi:Domain of unknown function (DUF4352)
VRRKKLTGRVLSSVLGIVFLVFVAAFVGGCGGENASSSSEDEVAEETTETAGTEPTTTGSTEEPTVSIGEPVTLGDVQWTVTDAERSDILVSRLGTEEGDFVIVNVTFQNNSNQDITLATPLLPLEDSQGREYEADIEANFIHVAAEENMFVDQVAPGATKEGLVIYAVEPDSSGFKLKVGEARFASSKSAYIDLGDPRSVSPS